MAFFSGKLPLKTLLLYGISFHTIIFIFIIHFFPESSGKILLTGIFSLTAPVLSAFLLSKAITNHENRVGKLFWSCIFTGIIVYLAAELYRILFRLFMSKDPPFPGTYDFLFLLQLILILFGIVYITLKNQNKYQMMMTIVDIVITAIVASSSSWYFLRDFLWRHSKISMSGLTMSIAYLALDLLILFGIIQGKLFTSLRHVSQKTLTVIGWSISGYFIIDLLFFYLSVSNIQEARVYLIPLRTIAVFFIGLSSLYPADNQDDSVKEQELRNFTHSLFVPLFYIVFLITIYLYNNVDMDGLLIAIFISFLLLFIRQLIMLDENNKLNQMLKQVTKELEEKNIQLKKTVEELESINEIRSIEARTDFLTGLYNRRFIDQYIMSQIYEAGLSGRTFSILLLDIDHFKSVNDRYGHDTGDIVLQKAARVFHASIRSSDVIGRFGGEEFLIILPETNVDSAYKMAKRIQRKINNCEIQVHKHCINFTVSIGITEWEKNDHFNDLYRRVDEALYEATKTRNTLVVKQRTYLQKG